MAKSSEKFSKQDLLGQHRMGNNDSKNPTDQYALTSEQINSGTLYPTKGVDLENSTDDRKSRIRSNSVG